MILKVSSNLNDSMTLMIHFSSLDSPNNCNMLLEQAGLSNHEDELGRATRSLPAPGENK